MRVGKTGNVRLVRRSETRKLGLQGRDCVVLGGNSRLELVYLFTARRGRR